MVRFRYALQPALDRALSRERAARDALRQANDIGARHRAALDDLRARGRDLRARRQTLVREHPTPGTLLDAEAASVALARERSRCLASSARADDAVKLARASFAHLAQCRGAFERHRAKARTAWQAREELRVASELDEVNALSQARAALSRKYLT